MKKFIYLLFALLALAAVVSCGKDDADGDVVDLGHETITTGAARDVDITTAVVDGNLRVTDDVLRDCTFGVIYSTQPGLDIDHCTGQQTSRSLEGQRFTVTLTGLRPETKYYYRAFVCIGSNYVYGTEKSFTTKETSYAYVDLGLPSGTLWATCNVGADNPEDYGYHFAWGEVVPKSTYTFSTYKWMKSGYSDWTGCSKYTIPDGQTSGCWYSNGTFVGDNKTELDLEDDAAYMNWGEGWRMPSRAQWYELSDTNNCTWTWTKLNGKNGYLVESKRNEASLFLPAAGYQLDRYKGADSEGDYWSRSLVTSNTSRAYQMGFAWGDVDNEVEPRGSGFSVRPVLLSASE